MAISSGSTARADDFITTSAGAGDSGRVPKLNSFGKLNESFFSAFSTTLLGFTYIRFNAISDVEQHVNAAGTASNQTGSSAYSKIGEIELNENITRLRVRWRIVRISISGGSTTYRDSAVFVNGVQQSGDIAYVSDSTVHSYDISGGLSSGDLLQIYARKQSSTETALQLRDFAIAYDCPLTHIGGVELVTPIGVIDPVLDVTDNL